MKNRRISDVFFFFSFDLSSKNEQKFFFAKRNIFVLLEHEFDRRFSSILRTSSAENKESVLFEWLILEHRKQFDDFNVAEQKSPFVWTLKLILHGSICETVFPLDDDDDEMSSENNFLFVGRRK